MYTKLKKIIKAKLKYFLYKVVYPKYYRRLSSCPVVANKLLFLEPNLATISNSLSYLYHRYQENPGFQVETCFVRQYSLPLVRRIKSELSALKTIANSKIIFIDEACPLLSCLDLRKETRLVQLWHGCGAFKKFGWSTADSIFGASREAQLMYPLYRNYSFVTVSSPEVVDCFVEAMRLWSEKEKVLPIGVSRTDCFFDKSFIESSYKKLNELIPQSRGKKIILYAPTFRGRVRNAKSPSKLNIELLSYFLSDDYFLLIKEHPIVRKRTQVNECYKNFCSNVTDLLTIDELICVSDICITDYSSLIFEYSLFSKPMIFFAYDLDNYIDWRGFYYKYEDFVPGPIVKNTTELLEVIKNISSYNIDKVEAFRKKFMSSCDGHSSDRIMDIVSGYLKE